MERPFETINAKVCGTLRKRACLVGHDEFIRKMGETVMLDGKRMLIVEDEPLLAMDLEATIEDSGGQTLEVASSVAQALTMIDAMDTLPDAAILDLDLGGEPSFPIADRLRAARVPFLFHTGHGDRAELKAKYSGVTVCREPVDPEEIVANLAKLMENSSPDTLD